MRMETNHRFVPDEVFETVEEAADTVRFILISDYVSLYAYSCNPGDGIENCTENSRQHHTKGRNMKLSERRVDSRELQ